MIFHFTILVFCFIDIPWFKKSAIPDTSTFVVDYVAITDKSKAPVISKDTIKADEHQNEKKDVLPKEPEIKEDVKEEEKVKEEIKREEIKEKEEEPKDSDLKEKKLPEKIEKPKKKDPPKKKDTPKKNEKPKEIKKPKKQEKDKKEVKKTIKKAEIDLSKKNSLDDFFEKSENRAEAIGAEVTASEIDAIRSKIRQCWQVSGGVQGAKDLVVDIDIELTKDGQVISAKVSEEKRMLEPAYRSVAESALRAIKNPKCQPIPIPKNKYNQFKKITMSFNPKDMF